MDRLAGTHAGHVSHARAGAPASPPASPRRRMTPPVATSAPRQRHVSAVSPDCPHARHARPHDIAPLWPPDACGPGPLLVPCAPGAGVLCVLINVPVPVGPLCGGRAAPTLRAAAAGCRGRAACVSGSPGEAPGGGPHARSGGGMYGAGARMPPLSVASAGRDAHVPLLRG